MTTCNTFDEAFITIQQIKESIESDSWTNLEAQTYVLDGVLLCYDKLRRMNGHPGPERTGNLIRKNAGGTKVRTDCKHSTKPKKQGLRICKGGAVHGPLEPRLGASDAKSIS